MNPRHSGRDIWFRAGRKCARHCQPRVLTLGMCSLMYRCTHLRACRRWRLQSDNRAPQREQQRDRVRRRMWRRFVRARALETGRWPWGPQTWCPRLRRRLVYGVNGQRRPNPHSRYAMARTYPRLRPFLPRCSSSERGARSYPMGKKLDLVEIIFSSPHCLPSFGLGGSRKHAPRRGIASVVYLDYIASYFFI